MALNRVFVKSVKRCPAFLASCRVSGLQTVQGSSYFQKSSAPHCVSISMQHHSSAGMDTSFHARRAVMYVPASDERKTKKATTLDIDTIVLDLEDGVAINQKDKARQLVHSALADCRISGQPSAKNEHVIRINGFDSGMLHLDLEAVYQEAKGSLPHAIMLPKCETVEQLYELDVALAFYHRDPTPMNLIIIIESPSGLVNLKDICSFGTRRSKYSHLIAVTFGAEDFLARLGGTRTKESQELLYARQSVVAHAKAFGLDAIDQVDTDFKDLEGLRLRAEVGARMGFTGKQVIHPDQVPVVRQAFSPSQERLKWASGLIDAWNEHQKSGKGAFVYEGHMIDKPLLLQAENIVKLHKAIS